MAANISQEKINLYSVYSVKTVKRDELTTKVLEINNTYHHRTIKIKLII